MAKPAVKVAAPSLTRIVLKGLAKGKPDLVFTVNKGKNAAKLRSFTVELPGALSFVRNGLKRGLSVSGAKLERYKLSARKLTITLKSPVNSVRVTLGPGALTERKQLQVSVRRHRARSLNMNVWASPGATGASFRTRVTIKRFS